MRTGADVVVGEDVIVYDPDLPYRRGRPGRVVKAARVWLFVAPMLEDGTVSRYPHRMRRDTQNQDTGRGYGGMQFFTLEQWTARLDRERAEETLRDAGVGWRFGYQWKDDGEVIKLADAVSAILAARDSAEVPE